MESISSNQLGLREILSNAIRYWELRRIGYNALLLAVVCGCVMIFWPQFRAALVWQSVLPLFVLAVLANVCYCAVYLVDIPLQLSDYRDAWRRWRILLWLTGAAFAAILASYFMMDEIYPTLV